MTSNRTVLLVEDDPDVLEALSTMLCRRGYRVLSAPDGHAAINLIGQQLPDVVVLEMMLPGQSGFQITRFVKERSNERIPVVMTTSNPSAAHRDYAFAMGVDRFLASTLVPTKLLEEVETLCPPLPTARINGSNATPRPTGRTN